MRVNGLLLVALFSKFLLGSSKRLRSPRQMMKRSLKVLGKAFGITGKPQQTVTQKPGGCRDLEISVKGDTLRILHMSDFHFHATMGCKEGDVPEALLQEPPWGPGAPVVKSACSRVTEAFLQKLTEDYLPHVDLVVLNGDLIHWNAVKAHETDLTAFLMKKPGFLQYFVDQANVHSVPVVVTLGNHDSPSMSCVNTAGLDAEGKGPSVMDCDVSSGTIKVDQEARRKRWESVQGLFSRSANLCTAEGVHGAGNLVAYANVNGQRLPLVFVDSGTALSRNEQPYRDAQDKEKLYDWVRPSQVGWVKEKLTQGESETGTLSVPGFVFTHHPPALTTRPVTTFWDSFALDEVQILSGRRWASSRNRGKPDQGENGGEFLSVERFSCALSFVSKRPLLPVISASEYSTDPKENWNLFVKEDRPGSAQEACARAEAMAFFDGPSKDRGETLMQVATSSKMVAALFSGHHHDNDYCAVAADTPVAFCYGGTAGYTAETYEKAKLFGPRPKGSILERQARMIYYTLPENGKAKLATHLIRDAYKGGTEVGPETVIPLR